MFTRVLTFTGASDIDAGVTFVRDEVLPVIRQQHGYRGLTLSADRGGREFGVLSVWASESDRSASDSALSKAREEARQIVGGELKVETFEELLVEVQGPPAPGLSLLVRRISMDPARIEENLEFFKRRVLPEITSSPGFRAVRNMVNRQTGEGIVGTVWADREAMKAAVLAGQARQKAAEQQGVSFRGHSERELLLVDLP